MGILQHIIRSITVETVVVSAICSLVVRAFMWIVKLIPRREPFYWLTIPLSVLVLIAAWKSTVSPSERDNLPDLHPQILARSSTSNRQVENPAFS
jgi:hypothetical protein